MAIRYIYQFKITYIQTNSIVMEPGGSMPLSQGLFNNPYLELNQPISLRSILILSSHLLLSLPINIFSVSLPVIILKALLPSYIFKSSRHNQPDYIRRMCVCMYIYLPSIYIYIYIRLFIEI